MLAKVLAHALLLLCHPRTQGAPPGKPKGWMPKPASDAFPDATDGVDEYEEIFDPNDPAFVARQRRSLEWYNQQRANQIAQNCPPVPPGARGDAGNAGKKPPPALPPASGSKPVPPTNCAPVSPSKAPRGDPPPQAQRILASVPPAPKVKAPAPTLSDSQVTAKTGLGVSPLPQLLGPPPKSASSKPNNLKQGWPPGSASAANKGQLAVKTGAASAADNDQMAVQAIYSTKTAAASAANNPKSSAKSSDLHTAPTGRVSASNDYKAPPTTDQILRSHDVAVARQRAELEAEQKRLREEQDTEFARQMQAMEDRHTAEALAIQVLIR